MLGLDMHRAPQQMHPAAAFQHQQGGFQLQQQAAPPPPSSFSPYSNTSSSRVVVSAAAVGAGHDDDVVGNGGGGKGGVVVPQQQAQQMASAACPWTRMKWTDAMVRLLIGVVYSVGDDGEGVATAGGAGAGRAGRAGHGHAAAAQQQKKGKWKSVSHAMMDKGFVVSPQQCEDKFNDLNKRYKRVVDLLGRGRACRVVENHALLDTLDDMTPKAKDEARKLLSSKHLFFREMCAYHNSAAAAGGSHLPAHAGGGDAACLHHPAPVPVAAAASSAARHAYAQHQAAPSPPGMKDSSADVADDDDDDDDDDDSDDDDAVSDNSDEDVDDYDLEEEDGHMYPSNNRPSHRQHSGGKRGRGEDLDDEAEGGGTGGRSARRRRRRKKAARVAPDPSAMLRQVKSELASATAAMDPHQVRSWMRRRALDVEEQQIRLDSHACYLDGQRLKWERFRDEKEHELQRARLQNDRHRMESRRLLLMLRHKDIELDMAEVNSSSVDHNPGAGASPLAAHQQQQQQQPIGSSPSPSTAGHPN
ncbi:hypothetical protein SORBI_3003G150400 [Sorghum bicolor]|uniref:Myb/SANT-like DNA-binding domain-containing protein n=2 Tax=Sorghum bicolor TaxID=4558 RepID=A0A1B6Q3A7_SORBI|nr:hypothetical protein SORBI_3003G150400 [Sorghum bicolor]